MTESTTRRQKSALYVPIDMLLATVGLVFVILPGVAVVNDVLGEIVSTSLLTNAVIGFSLGLSILYSAGYLSLGTLRDIALTFGYSVIAYSVGAIGLVKLFGINVGSHVPTAIVIGLSYLTAIYIQRENFKH